MVDRPATGRRARRSPIGEDVGAVDPGVGRERTGPELPGPPVGRPRANPRPLQGSARDEIVAVATRLFAEQGFAATTMAEIAQAAGLRQSSLYYYFRQKELILQATFTVNRAPLDFIRRLRSEPSSAALRLYRLIRYDVMQLCDAPCDINEVYRISLVQPDLFAGFWSERRELHRRTEQLVGDGMAEGALIDGDARLVALTVLSANEGFQNFWRLRGSQRLDGRRAGSPPRYSPADLGRHAATVALRGLLSRPATVTGLARQAERLDG
jgi:TetR/AcrR family transcriptional regulator